MDQHQPQKPQIMKGTIQQSMVVIYRQIYHSLRGKSGRTHGMPMEITEDKAVYNKDPDQSKTNSSIYGPTSATKTSDHERHDTAIYGSNLSARPMEITEDKAVYNKDPDQSNTASKNAAEYK
jgi:hypothetical protein